MRVLRGVAASKPPRHPPIGDQVLLAPLLTVDEDHHVRHLQLLLLQAAHPNTATLTGQRQRSTTSRRMPPPRQPGATRQDSRQAQGTRPGHAGCDTTHPLAMLTQHTCSGSTVSSTLAPLVTRSSTIRQVCPGE